MGLFLKHDAEAKKAHITRFIKAFEKGYSPEKPLNMKHIHEGVRFRTNLIKKAFAMIVGEGMQPSFEPIAQMFDAAHAQGWFDNDFLLDM